MKLFTLTGLSLLVASSALAFTLNSSTNPNLKGWAGGDVQIFVNSANCPAEVDVVALVKEAVKVWNDVPTSSIKVSYGGTTTKTTQSSPPIVYCETNYGGIPGNPPPDSVPGAAAVSAPGGQITSGYIFLNATSGAANIKNFSFDKVVIVMAHEIGHLLGLGHSHSDTALMYYDATYRNALALAQDDIDGMSYLYPSDELSDSKFAGCGLVRGTTPPSGGQMALLLSLLFLPLLAYLILRRRPKFSIQRTT